MNVKSISFALLILFAGVSYPVTANQLIVDYLQAGDTAVIQSGGTTYNLELMIVSDAVQKAMFSLNGERSRALRARERYHFSDGSQIIVISILTKSNSAGSMVEYYFIAPENPNSGLSGNEPIGLDYQYPDVPYDLTSLDEERTTESIQITTPPRIIEKRIIKKPQMENLTLPAKDECSTDEECDDHNGCTAEQCIGSPKKCVRTKTAPGCAFGTRYCVPTFRIYKFTPDTGAYCGLDGKWLDQQEQGSACYGDYECVSGLCENKQCIEPMIKEIETPLLTQTPTTIPPPQTTKGWWNIISELFSRLFG